jgi:hypothetical protein
MPSRPTSLRHSELRAGVIRARAAHRGPQCGLCSGTGIIRKARRGTMVCVDCDGFGRTLPTFDQRMGESMRAAAEKLMEQALYGASGAWGPDNRATGDNRWNDVARAVAAGMGWL